MGRWKIYGHFLSFLASQYRNMNTNLEIIRAACIKANPEIKERASTDTGTDSRPKIYFEFEDDIRLADVLLAIDKTPHWMLGKWSVRSDGAIATPDNFMHGDILASWNLHKDDLTQQSPETLQFLADLLK